MSGSRRWTLDRPGQGAALSIGAVLGTGVIALPALAAADRRPGVLPDRLAGADPAVRAAGRHVRRARRAPPRRRRCLDLRPTRLRPPRAPPWSAGASTSRFRSARRPRPCSPAQYVAAAVGGGRAPCCHRGGLILDRGAMNRSACGCPAGCNWCSPRCWWRLLVLTVVIALPHARLAEPGPLRRTAGARHRRRPPPFWSGAFAGWEAVTSLAADFRRPARDVPRATAIAVVVVGVLYLARGRDQRRSCSARPRHQRGAAGRPARHRRRRPPVRCSPRSRRSCLPSAR